MLESTESIDHKIEQLSDLIDKQMADIDGTCLACLVALHDEVECPGMKKVLELTTHILYREMLHRTAFSRLLSS